MHWPQYFVCQEVHQNGFFFFWITEFSICDPLSENPAHRAFYENRDKTGNRYTNV